MKVSVRIEPEAELQVEELSAWWRVHRPAARSLKAQLREAFKRIATAPHGGSIYERLGGETIRRVMIKGTPYAVYYYVDESNREAVIISVWSCQRGEAPLLPGR